MNLLASLGTLLLLSSVWIGTVEAKSSVGDRVLVLVPKLESAKHYSRFLDSLKTRGFDLSLSAASNTSVSLQIYGERLFDHAILLAPAAKKMGGGLTPQDFVRFVNDGGNLLVAVSSELSDFHRKLGKQFGIDFEPRGSWAIDHSEFAEQNNQTDHRLIAATNLAKVPAVLSPEILTGGSGTNASLPVFYKGIAHRYQAKNPLLIPLLVGSTTTYSGKTEVDKDGNIRSAAVDDMPLSGKSVGLVSVFQTRNNARVAFSGSTAL
ncbi:oligosaccharyl transferase glycoprotein complex, beta subunit, partial [Coemansia asiatica]